MVFGGSSCRRPRGFRWAEPLRHCVVMFSPPRFAALRGEPVDAVGLGAAAAGVVCRRCRVCVIVDAVYAGLSVTLCSEGCTRGPSAISVPHWRSRATPPRDRALHSPGIASSARSPGSLYVFMCCLAEFGAFPFAPSPCLIFAVHGSSSISVRQTSFDQTCIELTN